MSDNTGITICVASVVFLFVSMVGFGAWFGDRQNARVHELTMSCIETGGVWAGSGCSRLGSQP